MVLDQINDVNDIKKLNEEELEALRAEIRQFLVESIARTGGHRIWVLWNLRWHCTCPLTRR